MGVTGNGTTNEPREATILVVDDEEWVRDACEIILDKEGYRVVVAPDGKGGLDKLTLHKPDLVLVDVRMPGFTGIEFVRRAKVADPNLVAVIITGYGSIEVAVDAMKAGAFDILPKPFEPKQLTALVRRGVEQRRHLMATSNAEHNGLKIPKMLIVYHQFKGPVASLRQCLSVVLDGYTGEISDNARKMIQFAQRRADQLLHLLGNWEILTRLEDGEFMNQRQPLDLARIMDQVIAGFMDETERGQRRIVRGGATSVMVRGDAAAFTELFKNLMNNAVKYTPDTAEVKVDLGVENDDVVATVADDGPGIRAEDLERIFEPFFRGQAQRGIPGDGLGLTIARRIARLHGGDIRVESEVGRGSTFRVVLPLFDCLVSSVPEGRYI
jgi:signal transduction histidine kinase